MESAALHSARGSSSLIVYSLNASEGCVIDHSTQILPTPGFKLQNDGREIGFGIT